MRCYEADDIIAERKRADKRVAASYKAGFSAGYRKARVELLGEEEVRREERGYEEIVEDVLLHIQNRKK